ncbi:MAG: HofP DNA utilization family protein [Fimbriimonadales bacterium]|nr:HofP DNA utilization family protein [Fimbriimonadales bacterium]
MAKMETSGAKKPTNPKQLLIVAVLFVVLITIGIVQFGGMMGGGDAPKTNPQQSSTTNSGASRASAQPNQQASPTGIQLPPLSPRDPFRPTIVAVQAQPESNNKKVVRPTPAPRREITGTPPVPPMTLPPGQIGLQPAETAPPAEPEYPNYRIAGVVQGPNSVAILADTEGRRRFVKQGDLLEEGWRVVSIQRGTVTLRKGKEQITVRVGESTAPNGGNTP